MTVHIKVYLFKETYSIFNKDTTVIDNICKENKVKIKFISKPLNSYFTIEGKYEPVHKSRIILQDIEKEYYKELYNKDIKK